MTSISISFINSISFAECKNVFTFVYPKLLSIYLYIFDKIKNHSMQIINFRYYIRLLILELLILDIILKRDI